MPGSLLLNNDARSESSGLSSRSVDSKLKKVSFNKAVRVKQYPWRPETDINSAEHLILPSNRFWFKVYRNKSEPTPSEHFGIPTGLSSWNEDKREHTHDSLAPIAEVEDHEVETGTLNSIQEKLERYDSYGEERDSSNHLTYNNYNGFLNHQHQSEPPVDYLEDEYLKNYRNSIKPAWETTDANDSYISQRNNFRRSPASRSQSALKNRVNLEENNVFNAKLQITKDNPINNIRLPRMTLRNGPTIHSDRRFNASDASKQRERRSRSHDDHLDDESNFRELRKADKSVSTEDLIFNSYGSSPAKEFYKRSRDMATQCYDTLSRDRKIEKNNGTTPLFTRSVLNPAYIKGVANKVNIKSSPNRAHLYSNGPKLNPVTTKPNSKDPHDQFSSTERSAPKINNLTNTTIFNGRNFNSNYKKYDSSAQSKMQARDETLKFSSRAESVTSQPFRSNASKSLYSKKEPPQANNYLNTDSLKSPETVRNQFSSTVGYVRGRQIPLSEVNTNAHRKVLGKTDIANNRNLIPSKVGRSSNASSPIHSYKLQETSTAQPSSKKYFVSNSENIREKGIKKEHYSPKKPASPYSDEDNSVIDWSLSGFQLAPKTENTKVSVSDSECTVHSRPPLLMYIPGVSYHDRPVEEDDRLSALSDMSRSEMSDGINPLGYFTNNENGNSNNMRRRNSTPRDYKLKWIKWKSNGKK